MVHVEAERRAKERKKGKREKRKRKKKSREEPSGLYPETKLDARRDPGKVAVAVVMVTTKENVGERRELQNVCFNECPPLWQWELGGVKRGKERKKEGEISTTLSCASLP